MCAFLARSTTDGLFLKTYRPQDVKNKTEYWDKSVVGLGKSLKRFSASSCFSGLFVFVVKENFTIVIIGHTVLQQTPNLKYYLST